MKKKMLLTYTCFGLMLVLAACGSSTKVEHTEHEGSTSTSSPSASVSASNAETLYKGNCMSCHGGELQGKIGPSLVKVGGKLSEEQLDAKIQNGGGGMPGFKSKLKEPDVQALAEWLAAKK
ncbi:cytochrome c [Paenibacillus sp. 2RAB27]|uniref:c-type cytochrome n=1 Tax=Paenibacillus sp. 2RAB27 TaxID=3232991 RepID=UPI003F9B4577